LCGSMHEAWNRPFECYSCGASHERLEAVKEGVGEETANELNANWGSESETVVTYFSFSRQADEEGYLGIAQAFEKIAIEEAKHAPEIYMNDILHGKRSFKKPPQQPKIK